MGKDLLSLFVLSMITFVRWQKGSIYLPPLIWTASFVWAVWLRELRERQKIDFVNQLKSHRSELRSGGTIVVDNMLLRYDSIVTFYTLSVGAVLTSVNIPSQYRAAGGGESAESIVYSFCSLISGWWAFPSGPIITLTSIIHNLSGGEKTSVAMLIDRRYWEIAARENMRRESIVEQNETLEETSDFPILPKTGPGSPSERELLRPVSRAQGLSLKERLETFYQPQVPAEVLQKKAKRSLDEALAQYRQRRKQQEDNAAAVLSQDRLADEKNIEQQKKPATTWKKLFR